MKSVNDGEPLYSTHILALLQAIRGMYVVNGCDVVAGTGLEVKVNTGTLYYMGEFYRITSQESLSITANSSGHVRGDLVVWNHSSDSVLVRTGTGYVVVDGSDIPVIPRPEDDDIPLAVVIVDSGASSIVTDDIKDVRVNGSGSYMFDPMMVYEDMVETPTGDLLGDAYYDSTNEELVLTRNNDSESGQLEYDINPMSSWYAQFEYYSGGGDGGGSIYVYAYCESTPGTESDSCGGYTIALVDDDNSIKVYYDGTNVKSVGATQEIDDSEWHTVHVTFERRRIRVWIDGILQLDFTDSSRDLVGSKLGIAGRTGSNNNWHKIRFLKISKLAGILPIYV